MNLEIKKIVRLNPAQVAEVRALDQCCLAKDGMHAKIYWNIIEQRRTEDITDFLAYKDEQLIGYLGLYTFHESEVELSGMVHPDFRQQQVFTTLWQTAQNTLKGSVIKEMVFVCSHGAMPAEMIIKKMGASLDFSEYVMRIDTPPQLKPPTLALTYRRADKKDIFKLVQFDMACFNNKFEEGLARFSSTIDAPNREAWLVYDQNNLVGKVHLRFDEHCSYIHDFAVLPQYQGKGYGKAILYTKLKELRAKGHTVTKLDVTVTNESALNLYRKCGFKIITAYDFWRLKC